MKFSSTLVSIFAAAASAKSLLAVFPNQVTVGETYQVEWLSDSKEILELLLVHKLPNGWKPVTTLFEDKMGEPMGGNYSWRVGKKTPTGEGYALWLSGKYYNNPDHGYADLTKWFEILPAKDEKKADLKV